MPHKSPSPPGHGRSSPDHFQAPRFRSPSARFQSPFRRMSPDFLSADGQLQSRFVQFTTLRVNVPQYYGPGQDYMPMQATALQHHSPAARPPRLPDPEPRRPPVNTAAGRAIGTSGPAHVYLDANAQVQGTLDSPQKCNPHILRLTIEVHPLLVKTVFSKSYVEELCQRNCRLIKLVGLRMPLLLSQVGVLVPQWIPVVVTWDKFNKTSRGLPPRDGL
ncbi:hypothetical protein C8J56DRAFT_890039 [Mycena floridula]|nr:hypothetical protein C8J56DRAFT_890039 [Mycena floridula]